jgi:hypothetical protein
VKKTKEQGWLVKETNTSLLRLIRTTATVIQEMNDLVMN